MRTLQFDVRGQTITKSKNCNFENIAKGTKNYLKCRFNFDNEWNGFSKVAVFESMFNDYPVSVDNNNECMVPSQVTENSSFWLKVIGGNKETRITTNKIQIKQEG